MRWKQLWTMAVAATTAIPTIAEAQFMTYNSQVSFLAAITNPGVDTFTGFALGTAASPLTRSAGAYSYKASVTDDVNVFGAGTVGDPWLSIDFAPNVLTFSTFTSGVAAVGGNFFGSDADGLFQSGNIVVTYVDATGTYSQTLVAPTGDTFFGVVSLTGAMISFSIQAVQPSDEESLWPTVDNLTLGQGTSASVPEPAPAALIITGLLAMGLVSRRRNSAR